MRNRNGNILLRGTAILLLVVAIVFTIVALIGYSRQRNNYPKGMTIAGVPVGGLNPQAATQRVLEVFNSPVEIQYGGGVIHVDPTVVGFQMDVESMLAAADLTRTGGSFWNGFWDYLWNRDPAPISIPLRASIAEERLRAYLHTEVAPRYDLPSTAAQPIPGTTTFIPGRAGQTLDVDRAVPLIEDALRSPASRTVALTYTISSASRPTIDNLEIQLKQLIAKSGFDGTVGVYMLDLQNGQEIHFALTRGREINVDPDLSFTASSTIKIPILVSFFIQHGTGPVSEESNTKILNMIKKSENPPSDALMAELNSERGPLVVSDFMKTLGLNNTFIAGYFEPGSPLLQRYSTPANQRTDVTTDPDSYNQTTTSDMGMLLEDIYQCSQSGGGALVAAFPDKINQAVCKQIINYLTQDKIGVLIEAGVPEGTQVAHKHGWVVDPATNIMRNVSDAGIVYSPGGNFALAVYAYHPVQIIWDNANALIANLSQAVYNYYNLRSQ